MERTPLAPGYGLGDPGFVLEQLQGDSPAWREAKSLLPRVAESDLPVLLLGETGTGKELMARAVHALSPRRRRAFVAMNCGATPDSLIESELFGHARGAFTGAVGERPGLFEAADQGTLFLDEIGDASALLQMKLLRVLQEGEVRRVGDTVVRKVDVRIVAATHRELHDAVSGDAFRADLFYRLNAVSVRLPPLRERGSDIVMLARLFLARAARAVGAEPPELTPALAAQLARHRWPGNVRELVNGCLYCVRVAGARDRVDRALALASRGNAALGPRSPCRDPRARGAPPQGDPGAHALEQVACGSLARALSAGVAQEAPPLRAGRRARGAGRGSHWRGVRRRPLTLVIAHT